MLLNIEMPNNKFVQTILSSCLVLNAAYVSSNYNLETRICDCSECTRFSFAWFCWVRALSWQSGAYTISYTSTAAIGGAILLEIPKVVVFGRNRTEYTFCLKLSLSYKGGGENSLGPDHEGAEIQESHLMYENTLHVKNKNIHQEKKCPDLVAILFNTDPNDLTLINLL